MSPLAARLLAALGDVPAVTEEADGALTVRYDDTLASLRVVTIADGLDLVSLTQILAWDLPATRTLRDRVIGAGGGTLLGSLTLVEKPAEATPAGKRGSGKRGSGKTADVLLRYNFPGAGLADDALRTLVLLVLDAGAELRRTLTG